MHSQADWAAAPAPHATARHYGKYRGTVTDNQDPRKQARIKAKVPEILGDVDSGWATPCAPYAGDQIGAYAVPAKDAGVWIEFEAGDASRPIWSGCWWPANKLPNDEAGTAATPDVKMTRSEQGLIVALHDDSQTIVVSDSNAANILKIEVQNGIVTLKATSKIVVDAPAIEVVANASHSAVFGDSLMTYLNQVVSTFNAHMHPGEVAGPYPVTPMSPVSTLSAPTSDMLSTIVKLG